MAKELKDWTKQIEGLAEMDLDGVTNLYSEMLATAHDIGYKVPDEQLIETEDPEQLKKVIPPLHQGILDFHSAKQAEAKQKAAAAKAAKTKKTAPTKADAAPKKSVAKKPAKAAAQKDVSKETEMATATTAKKAAAPKKAAKKAAKAPAKKAGKKAASANARTPAAGRFTGTEVITVKFKEVPGRAGSGVHDRLANLAKYSGKTVDAFLKSSLGRTSTLHKAVKQGWITIK